MFEKNLEVLKKYNYRITEELQSFFHNGDKEDGYVLLETKNHDIIPGVDKDNTISCLASRYDPDYEAQQFFSEDKIISQSVMVLYGFSNGAFARYIHEKYPEIHVVVYEPDIRIFGKMIMTKDYSDLFDSEFVHVATGEHGLELFKLYIQAIVDRYNFRYTTIKSLEVYRRLFPEEYKSYLNVIREALHYMEVNMNTEICCGDSMTFASVQNMRFLKGCRSGADYYKDVFPEEMPAIVVSAGPSLQKNIEVLKQAKGRALIVVVDTALRTVVAHGIQPDIVFTIDSEKPVELFEVCDLSKTFVFAEMVSNPQALEKIHTENLVFYSSNSPVWADLFEKSGSEIRTVRAGGSVATESIANLIACGFRKIILIGQDLAYTDNKQYAQSEALSEEDLKRAEEGLLLQNGNYGKCRKIKDIYGNDVYTPNDYYSYIKEIERLGYRFPSVEIIDATEGGAWKDHTTIMTLQEAINQYCTTEYDIDKILSMPKRLFVDDKEKLLTDRIDQMIENFKRMKVCFQGGVAACENGKYLMENKIYDVEALREINTMIQDIDEMYTNALERTLISQCVPWAEYNFYGDFYEEEEDDIKETVRLYTKSIDYYGQLAQACQALMKVTENCREKIK